MSEKPTEDKLKDIDANISKEFHDNVKVHVIEPKTNPKIHLTYNFNVGYAEIFGINESIILQNIIFWTEKNKVNNNNYHDDRFWVYNSVKAWKELFPFWTQRQLRTILDNMVKKNILLKGCYNKKAYDRTTWHAMTDKTLAICQMCQINLSEVSNQIDQIDEPIPINNPINNPNKESVKEKPNKVKYKDNISLTEKQHNKLLDKYGIDNVNKLYEHLSSYKIEKGYKTKCDYRTITRWVIGACKIQGVQNEAGEFKEYQADEMEF